MISPVLLLDLQPHIDYYWSLLSKHDELAYTYIIYSEQIDGVLKMLLFLF